MATLVVHEEVPTAPPPPLEAPGAAPPRARPAVGGERAFALGVGDATTTLLWGRVVAAVVCSLFCGVALGWLLVRRGGERSPRTAEDVATGGPTRASEPEPGPPLEGAVATAPAARPSGGSTMGVRILFDRERVGADDRITLRAVGDGQRGRTVYLRELTSGDALPLADGKSFATAVHVGERAQFQSSGVVVDGSTIVFDADRVEVNALA